MSAQTPTRTAATLTITLGLMLGAGGGGGCNNSSWNASLLPEGVTISTLEPASTDPIEGAPLAEASVAQAGNTAATRDTWEPVALYTPPATLDHGPLYYRDRSLGTPIARDRGEYPTLETCLQTDTPDDDGKRIAEVFIQPVFAAGSTILMPIRAVATPPWREVHTRTSGYERVPATIVPSGATANPQGVPVDEAPLPQPTPAVPPESIRRHTETMNEMQPVPESPADGTRPITP